MKRGSTSWKVVCETNLDKYLIQDYQGDYIANPHPVDRSSNLIPLNKRTPEERKEIQRKGAERAAFKKKEYKTQREIAKTLMSMKAVDLNADLDDVPPEVRDSITVGELMALRQLQKALSPVSLEGFDTTAYREIKNTADGMPTQAIEAVVQTTSTDDISLDEALSIASSIEPEKPKTSKPRARKKSE